MEHWQCFFNYSNICTISTKNSMRDRHKISHSVDSSFWIPLSFKITGRVKIQETMSAIIISHQFHIKMRTSQNTIKHEVMDIWNVKDNMFTHFTRYSCIVNFFNFCFLGTSSSLGYENDALKNCSHFFYVF